MTGSYLIIQVLPMACANLVDSLYISHINVVHMQYAKHHCVHTQFCFFFLCLTKAKRKQTKNKSLCRKFVLLLWYNNSKASNLWKRPVCMRLFMYERLLKLFICIFHHGVRKRLHKVELVVCVYMFMRWRRIPTSCLLYSL